MRMEVDELDKQEKKDPTDDTSKDVYSLLD